MKLVCILFFHDVNSFSIASAFASVVNERVQSVIKNLLYNSNAEISSLLKVDSYYAYVSGYEYPKLTD